MSVITITRTGTATYHVSGSSLATMETTVNRAIDRLEANDYTIVSVHHTITEKDRYDRTGWSALITYRFTVTTREDTDDEA